MTPAKQCPACEYAVPNPDAPMEAIMSGQRQLLCLRNPPTPTALQQGLRIAIMMFYPTVDSNTVSCGEWADREMVKLKKDAWATLHFKDGRSDWPVDDSDPSKVGE